MSVSSCRRSTRSDLTCKPCVSLSPWWALPPYPAPPPLCLGSASPPLVQGQRPGSSPVGMSHGRRSVRSLGGAPLSRALRRADCHHATTEPNHGRPTDHNRPPPPIPPPTGALFRRVLPCVLWSSASWSRAACERAACDRPADRNERAADRNDRQERHRRPRKRIAEVTGPCLRPPQRTPPPPTYTPARSLALCCRALVSVRLRPARARLRVCAYSTGPTPLAACLAGGHAGARRSRARGRTCDRESAGRSSCAPPGLEPGSWPWCTRRAGGRAGGSTTNEWVERGRVGLVESRLHLSVN